MLDQSTEHRYPILKSLLFVIVMHLEYLITNTKKIETPFARSC